MIYSITAYGINHETLFDVCARGAVNALATYRLFLGIREVQYISLSIAVLHCRAMPGALAAIVQPLQYGYNGTGCIAHFRQIKVFQSPAYARRWSL